MKLPKYLTTITTFSKILAMILFILLPILGFKFGMDYQKKINTQTLDSQKENKNVIKTPAPLPIASPVKIPSLNKPGWFRYMSDDLDYYLDYPNTYIYNKQGDEEEISFEKNLVKTPHGIDNYINLIKDQSIQETKEKISELKKMVIGEKKVVTIDQPDKDMNQFRTYERLPDNYVDNKKMKTFVNKKPFESPEGTSYYLYMYEGKVDYIFGTLTTESKDSLDNISYSEFKEIISTIRFLD